MQFLRKDNYVTIVQLLQRITAKQNQMLEKYSTNSRDTLLNIIMTDDLEEWQALEKAYNDLRPIVYDQNEYD